LSLASSKTPPSAEPEPSFDLDYSIHDFEAGEPHRDSEFLFRRIEEAMVDEGAVPGGRALDVASGTANLVARLFDRGTQAWGIEPSVEMNGIARYLHPNDHLILVRGIAEQLPFRDGVFDCVTCQGSLDHFVHPENFMQEAARILKPDGRLVLALANYESLSCKLGRLRMWVRTTVLRRPPLSGRPYYEIPLDHYHKGDLPFVRRLGGQWMRGDRLYGISMLWLLPRWGVLLDRLPGALTRPLLVALDRVAHRLPALSDMIISVWRPLRPR